GAQGQLPGRRPVRRRRRSLPGSPEQQLRAVAARQDQLEVSRMSVRTRMAVAVAALVTGLAAAAPAARAEGPGSHCLTVRADKTLCESNAMRIGPWAWMSVDLACPDDRPWVRGDQQVVSSPNRSSFLYLHGPYDNGPDDGGHFWLRVNNLNLANVGFYVKYE